MNRTILLTLAFFTVFSDAARRPHALRSWRGFALAKAIVRQQTRVSKPVIRWMSATRRARDACRSLDWKLIWTVNKGDDYALVCTRCYRRHHIRGDYDFRDF